MSKFVVTGAAGFIGSHLVADLLKQGAYVIGVDNLWTGHTYNLQDALREAGPDAESRFEFYEQDIRDFTRIPHGAIVYHLAALGSVPRSIEKPLQTHQSNVDGFFQILNLARKLGAEKFIYASSSSVYGDSEAPYQIETILGRPLSPYAATKRINEIYAQSFSQAFGMECIGLRFFNVYGPRQRSDSSYAAVIPKWIEAMKSNRMVEIFGDGHQVRDFTYVKDVIHALQLARFVPKEMSKLNPVFNVGTGRGSSLLDLFSMLKEMTGFSRDPIFTPAREGDKKQSVADLTISKYGLLYLPKYSLAQGLSETIKGSL